MIGFLAAKLVGRTILGRTVTEGASKVIVWVGLALALLLVLGTAKCAYDRSVIRNYTANQNAANAKADRKADQAAAEQRREDDARLTTERKQLEEAGKNATNPTDRRIARHRCIRLQQDARAAGREPPACD